MKSAEILSVGTELLLGQIIDTHAPYMARILADAGIACTRRATIGDNYERIVAAIQEALARADILITIGGLGPTMDDLTREAIAEAIGDSLVRDDAYEQELRAWFAARNYPFAESNAKQADRPEHGRTIPNPNGTAPGLLCEKNGKVIIAMPGPKGEFQPMADGFVRSFLESVGGGVIHSRVLRVIGVGESMVEERIRHLMDGRNPSVAPYAHVGEVHLRLTASAPTREEADAIIDPMEVAIRDILGASVYGVNETSLEEAVLLSLTERGETLAVAESMTGGGFSASITAVPGASKAFLGGYVTYTVAQKQALGIPADVLDEFGPVSQEVARLMAEQTRVLTSATWSLSITGNAGPTADKGDKPIGLTYIAVAGPEETRVSEHKLRGTREDIQRRATRIALTALRDAILTG